MSDEFMDLLSGEGAKPQDQGEQGAGDMLGSLLGGGSAGGLGDLLGSLLGGAGGGAGAGAAGGDMTDLLGSLMGGGASSGGSSSQGNDLGGLLGGTGGGQTEASGGGLGDLLGGLMGGGGMGGLLGGLLGGGSDQMSFGGGGGASLPFAGALAEKLGISEQMASMLIMGAIGLLTSSMAKKRSAGLSGEVNFNDVTDPDFIRSSGVAGQLSGRMGISEDEAVYGLQQTMNLMAAGGQPAPQAQKAPPKKSTDKKSTSADAPKKSTSKAPKTAAKKKSSKKKSGSDFQDLLDDTTS